MSLSGGGSVTLHQLACVSLPDTTKEIKPIALLPFLPTDVPPPGSKSLPMVDWVSENTLSISEQSSALSVCASISALLSVPRRWFVAISSHGASSSYGDDSLPTPEIFQTNISLFLNEHSAVATIHAHALFKNHDVFFEQSFGCKRLLTASG